ncbi:phosphonate C-P lyase system protein PhnH [Amycolatopsis sp. FDAARGOS 1241]|uniref:phosphonate C-P lyase system protein PhnH n=1 Tax=Amycolatopsis sp. FDAARGOS 1241 TaxID=2778070 RepID=UPI00194F1215|nr:phosphonate C-P lyase system protein PhnH [Amycolatopsis sp. FDAARGOS 1241]QRP43505.1 phosphonate C-P lyase system protein PhnH [Amycolatopsis sp. FDAARGOS 1241]
MTTATGTTASAVLRPAESQQVFRTVLEALSRPGTVQQLPADLAQGNYSAVLPVLALADLGTGVCVLEEGTRWADAVALATSAPIRPLELARLVAAVRPVTAGEITKLCRGSAPAPEDAALAALAVSDVDGGDRRWRLSGPGVPGELTLAPRGLPAGFAAARAEAVAGYPAGVDLLLVTEDGRVTGLPRTTIIEED